MFNSFVDLEGYLSSVKLIVGSAFIFLILLAINVCIITGLSHIVKPRPSHKKNYLVMCSVITMLLNIIFFILSLYDKASVALVLILIAVFAYLEYWLLSRFSDNNPLLARVVIVQTATNSALYFIGSYLLSSFYILLFCVNGI